METKEYGESFMRDFLITVLLIIIIVLIIVGVGILGINIYNDVDIEKVGSTVQNFIEDIEVKQDDTKDYYNESNLDKIKSTDSTEEKNITYSNNNSKNNYFYSQLNEYSKIIYNGLQNNIENLKTGTYKIEFGNTFSGVLSNENGQEILSNYYQSAIEAFMYDNTDIFYLNVNKMYLNIESTKYANRTTYNVYISNGNQNNYLADGFYSKEQINKCQREIEEVKKQVLSGIGGLTEYQKILKIHDYLVDNISYDSSLSKDNIYNMYGALINKQCVCEGYSKAFKYLLDEAKIENVIVIGKATNSEGKSENHSWNYVLLDDKWYAIDVTWDDPIIRGGGKLSKSSKYKYFLKGSSSINKDHTPIGQFTENGKVFTYPTLSSRDYN